MKTKNCLIGLLVVFALYSATAYKLGMNYIKLPP